mmetsp:Transcript_33837/g.84928  ORF Transcript_33837/g.84928 Transcript_33837/m.84928 type:complete len:209 (+) Transcript_33837:76-702(+)
MRNHISVYLIRSHVLDLLLGQLLGIVGKLPIDPGAIVREAGVERCTAQIEHSSVRVVLVLHQEGVVQFIGHHELSQLQHGHVGVVRAVRELVREDATAGGQRRTVRRRARVVEHDRVHKNLIHSIQRLARHRGELGRAAKEIATLRVPLDHLDSERFQEGKVGGHNLTHKLNGPLRSIAIHRHRMRTNTQSNENHCHQQHEAQRDRMR